MTGCEALAQNESKNTKDRQATEANSTKNRQGACGLPSQTADKRFDGRIDRFWFLDCRRMSCSGNFDQTRSDDPCLDTLGFGWYRSSIFFTNHNQGWGCDFADFIVHTLAIHHPPDCTRDTNTIVGDQMDALRAMVDTVRAGIPVG